MRVLKILFKIAGKTVKLAFIVFFIYIVSLFFRTEHISGEFIERTAARFLPDNLVFHCDSASLSLLHGLCVRGIKLYDTSRKNPISPVIAAESVSVALFERHVKVVAVRMPRLQDSYYEAGPYAEPLGDREIDFAFPLLPDFTLELERPSILGVEPERVVAHASSRPDRMKFQGINLDWADRTFKMSLNGFCRVDLARRRVSGKVQGHATQAQIRPLMVALDLPAVLPYMDAFTGVIGPVPASCSWDVNLVDNDFRLNLDLHPKLGFYNGVPMSQADGGLSVHTTFPVRNGTRCMDYVLEVGPLAALDSKDRPMSGRLIVRGVGGATVEDDIVHIEFDSSSELAKDDILNVAGFLNDGVLDCLQCDSPPDVKIRGILATDVAHQSDNNLLGSVAFSKGSLFGINLLDASSAFAYVGDKVTFFDAAARGRDGGAVAGMAQLSLPELDAERATFSLDVAYTGGSIGELADMLHFDPGDRSGNVEGALRLAGPMTTNLADRIDGGGYLKVTNGHLAQMRLFMGLTDLLANEVPGIEHIVNQSEASASFLIEKGVVRSRDILIEGALFSISAQGEYSIPLDNLDFTVRVEIMRKDSILGKYLIRPILWPFTKLLLEFRLEGPIENPKWDYISVLDRIM